MISNQQKEAQMIKDTAVEKTLDKFFAGKKKETRQKFEEVEKIKAQIEEGISAKATEREARATKQLKGVEEDTIIESGGVKYFSHMKGLDSAMPATEEERQKDMDDLMDAVKSLEMLDADHYDIGEDEAVEDEAPAGGLGGLGGLGGGGGMAKAMLYDNVSQKLLDIIDEHEYNDLRFIQAEKLENLAMDKIKSLEHDDFIDTLKMMKDVGYIEGLLEINPEINLILFTEDKISLTQAEKVVISFVAEEEILTTERLKEHTLWEAPYMNQILGKLQKKGILEIIDKNLVIKGLITPQENKEFHRKKEEIKEKQEEKEKKLQELEKQRLQMEIDAKKAKEREKQKELEEQRESLLKEAKEKADEEQKSLREQAEKQAEIEGEKRLESIRAMPKPKVKELPGTEGKKKKPPIRPNFSPKKPRSPIPLPKEKKDEEKKKEKEAVSKDAVKLAEAAEEFSKELEKGEAPLKIKKEEIKGEKEKKKEVKKPEAEKVSEAQRAKAEKLKEEELTAKTLKGKDGVVVADEEDMDMSAFESMLDEVPDEEGFGQSDSLDSLKGLVNKMEKAAAAQKNDEQIKSDVNELEDFFSDVDSSEEVNDEVSENQPIIDGIINIVNDLADKTGGLVTLSFLLETLHKMDFPDLKKMKLMEVMDEIKEQKILRDEVHVAGEIIYLFDDIVFDDEMMEVLKQFVLSGKVDGDTLIAAMDWELEHLARVLKRFREQNILEVTEDKMYYIPGLFNYEQD